jgi:hypothetical protein
MPRMNYRKRSNRRRYKRGGEGAANPSSYDSASTYMRATVGTPNQQYDNVFDSSKSSNSNSNAIVGLQGQKAGTKKKRGGYWSQVFNQAIVPFSILGMQQTYRRKRGTRGGKGSRSSGHGGRTRRR